MQDERCSIYADRPLTCREFLVTSPAEHCARPTQDTIRCVQMPLKVQHALTLFDPVAPGTQFVRWVPLALALEWADAHPDETPPRPGPELLRELFNNLAERQRSENAPAAPQRAA